MAEDRMLKWFKCQHMPSGEIKEISVPFESLALVIVDMLEAGPERTVALRKLLEARDAAIRAVVHPEG